MKKLTLFMVVMLTTIGLHQSNAQIPDDTDGRLYRLCKTWGYVKYFSQHKCELKWDTLLNTTINEVLIANSNADFNDALMTMFNKVGNNLYVATPGSQPDTNINFDNSWINDPVFSQPVRDFLDTFSIYIYPDTSTCFVKFNDYSIPGYYGYIDFRDDPLSMPIDYSNEAHRLTTMFYYWNVINYFFPYRSLMDESWESTLCLFIPVIRQTTSSLDFHINFLKLVTKINDTHGSTNSPYLSTYFWGGSYLPKINLTRVDSLCVVTKVEGITGVSPGDVLIALKGIPIQEIEDSLALYIPASTPASLYRDIYYRMLWGENNSTLSLTFLDNNNNIYTTYALRSQSLSSWNDWKNDNGLTSSYFITTCDYGYVNMGMLQPEEVPDMYNLLKDAPVIIFDIRNYPNGTLWDLGPLLFPAPIISAIFYDPALTWLPSPYYYYYMPGWYYERNDYYNLGWWSNPSAYAGRVYILVNEETQSQAEYTCQYLSYHPDSKVIGMQTDGADGDISYLTLPVGITTCFTSLGWYYADGYQQQRNGVKIDSVVSPTIVGIRQGRDEILEAALDCLVGIKNIPTIKPEVSVYPNPVSDGSLHITLTLDKITDLTISLLDLTGKIIQLQTMKGIPGYNDLLFNTRHLATGMYLLNIQNGKESVNLKVAVK
jgi:hypothetical protein